MKNTVFLALGLLIGLFAGSMYNSCQAQKATVRSSDQNIVPVILNRWSARAMSGQELTEKEIQSLFSAAHLAPSSYNMQPWTFLYAKKNTPAWDTFFNLMVDFNKSWAQNAGLLIVVVSKDNGAQGPNRTAAFDTGAAWENLALQATHLGLVSHGMGGFDYDRAKKDLNIPDGYTVQAMVAIGRSAKKEVLPEFLRDKEQPSPRNALAQHLFEGGWKN